MYVPAEDTLFLIDCAKQYWGRWALEIGTGSGAVAKSLLANFKSVVATDIDFAALLYCKEKGLPLIVCCDAARALRGCKFDLVVSNPPYLPGEHKEDTSVYGGEAGLEMTLHFIESALPLLSENGKILVLISSLADSGILDRFMQEKNLKKRLIAERALFFERLCAIELTS